MNCDNYITNEVEFHHFLFFHLHVWFKYQVSNYLEHLNGY